MVIAGVLLAALVWQVLQRMQCEAAGLAAGAECEHAKVVLGVQSRELVAAVKGRNYTTNTKRVLVIGRSGVGKSSLVRGLLLFMEPNREDHRLPKAVTSKQPGTMETTEYFGGRVDFEANLIETYSFFDTRLYDAYADEQVRKSVEGILARELSKIDIALFCIDRDRTSPSIQTFMREVLKPVMEDKRVALGVVGTHLGDLSDVERGMFLGEVRHDFLNTTGKDNPPLILAGGWNDAERAYNPSAMRAVLKQISSLTVKRSL